MVSIASAGIGIFVDLRRLALVRIGSDWRACSCAACVAVLRGKTEEATQASQLRARVNHGKSRSARLGETFQYHECPERGEAESKDLCGGSDSEMIRTSPVVDFLVPRANDRPVTIHVDPSARLRRAQHRCATVESGGLHCVIDPAMFSDGVRVFVLGISATASRGRQSAKETAAEKKP